MTDQEILEGLLSTSRHMVVAVVLADGKPWAVPVHITKRTSTTLEWQSKRDTEHSRAILEHPDIALTIFSIEDDLGFYAKATAAEISDGDRGPGYAVYRATVHESWLNEQHRKRPCQIIRTK